MMRDSVERPRQSREPSPWRTARKKVRCCAKTILQGRTISSQHSRSVGEREGDCGGMIFSSIWMKIYEPKEKGRPASLFRPQQNVVEFANALQFVLQLVIVRQPPFRPHLLVGPEADLLVAATGVVDGKNPRRMAATLGAGSATLLMPDGAFQQGTTQNLRGRADRVSQFIALADGVTVFHLHR